MPKDKVQAQLASNAGRKRHLHSLTSGSGGADFTLVAKFVHFFLS
jgi:hypothetical protein